MGEVMENKEFKPYVPATKISPELTITSIVVGILLAVIFVYKILINGNRRDKRKDTAD